MDKSISPQKAYNFGKIARADMEFGDMSWEEFSSMPEFVELKFKRRLNFFLVECIRKGFLLEEMPILENNIISFGKYKDKQFSELPDDYIEWLDKQPWITSHGLLFIFVKQSLKTKDKPLSSSELSKQLNKIKETLK